MGRTLRKYICLRVPEGLKDEFYKKREEIKKELDKIIQGEKELQFKEAEDLYAERVFFTVDLLYYEKLQELAKKYRKPISKIIRSVFLNLS